jgi:AcrR family transcriptional regulator
MNVGNADIKRHRAAHLGPERRRPAVLDAALKLAVERGVRGVTMEAIAQEMGVTKPVIYACFASREEVLRALLAREEQQLFDGVVAALPARPDFSNPEQLMIAGFQALLGTVAAQTDSWKLVFAADADPAIAGRYGQAREQVAQRVAMLMAPGLTALGVTEVERKLPVLVELFMSIGDGAVRSLLQPPVQQQWSPDELGVFIGRIVFGAFQKA